MRRPGRDRLRAELQLDDRRGQGRGPVRAGAVVHQRARLLRAPGAPGAGQRRQLHAVLGVCGTAKLSSFSSSKDLVPSVGCCECCGGRRGCRPWLAGCLFVKVDVLTPLCWPPAAKCLALCAQHVARAATVRNCACAVRRRAGILPPALQAVVPHAQQVRGRCATAVSCRPCRSCRWTLLSEHSAAAACHASQP